MLFLKPFLKDSAYANNLQHAVISSDSKTLFLRWTNSTGGVTRGVAPSENTAEDEPLGRKWGMWPLKL
jgi:hypothetical protein